MYLCLWVIVSVLTAVWFYKTMKNDRNRPPFLLILFSCLFFWWIPVFVEICIRINKFLENIIDNIDITFNKD